MPDELPLDSGANGIILPSSNGNLVRKKMRRNAIGNSIELQIRIHLYAQRILRDENNFTTLRAPYMVWNGDAAAAGGGSPASSNNEYWMERIDTSRPLWLGDLESVACYPRSLIDNVQQELVRYWQQMWRRGYAAWDFELYVQRDGSVVILDFDKYGRQSNDTYSMPYRVNVPEERFFQHICFPPGFAEQVGNPFRANM